LPQVQSAYWKIGRVSQTGSKPWRHDKSAIVGGGGASALRKHQGPRAGEWKSSARGPVQREHNQLEDGGEKAGVQWHCRENPQGG